MNGNEKVKEHRSFDIDGHTVRTLRFARLGEDGKVIVESAPEDFNIDNDDSFKDVGVCSYAWLNERVSWFDEETQRNWLISSRCLVMCKAALENFKKVWIDGLCIVQDSIEHKKAVMAVMGKIYYRGTCVPEVIIGMEDIYFHRGWVQQEIAFTNIKIHSNILRRFFEKNEKIKDHYQEYSNAMKGKKKEKEEGEANSGKTKDAIFWEYELCDVTTLFRDLKPTIRFLLRIISGRGTGEENDETLVNKLSEYYNLDAEVQQEEIKLDLFYVKDANMYGDYSREEKAVKGRIFEQISYFFDLMPDCVWSSPREDNQDQIRYAAIISYSTGFFTYNEDRLIACFALASFALYNEQDYKRLQDELDDIKYEQEESKWRKLVLKRKGTVIANPGRYCTGYQNIFPLKTLPIFQLVVDFLKLISDHTVLNKDDSFDGHRPYTDRHNLDVMFSVIYATTPDRKPNYIQVREELEKYDYVMGYRVESSEGVTADINSALGRKLPLVFQILGLKPKGSDGANTYGLVSEYSKKARFTHYGGSHRNRFAPDSDTQHLDALRVIVDNSFEMHQLKILGREREVKMIEAATDKAIKFLDYAFSYMYNFVIAETLDEENKWPKDGYNMAKMSLHTKLPKEQIDAWRKSVRETVKDCKWGHDSWEHFGFV